MPWATMIESITATCPRLTLASLIRHSQPQPAPDPFTYGRYNRGVIAHAYTQKPLVTHAGKSACLMTSEMTVSPSLTVKGTSAAIDEVLRVQRGDYRAANR